MLRTGHSADPFRHLLEECGYTGTRLKPDFSWGSKTIPLVGFASKPWDFDSACIAVLESDGDPEGAVRSCRDLGAPIVWVRYNGTVDWWMQHGDAPTRFESKPIAQFPAFVRQHKDKLDPISIYRGKTVARVDKSRQLDFVDAGYLPLLREEAGEKLHQIVEEMIKATLKALHRSSNPSKVLLQDVFTSVFRLLAGKIFKDKEIGIFSSVDLTKPGDVLKAVAAHYETKPTKQSAPASGYAALKPAARLLSECGSFSVVSPESLAYVYEHTLVTNELRKKLGIHATPPWLVDYMVWQLYDWVREIPVDARHIFEPACGHAPFLLSMMRLLRMEMHGKTDNAVHKYLKDHVHGVEIDDFAREIARLSLTLADIPNPNGWDLQSGDMFASDVLIREAKRCRVLLSNPPYEKFDEEDRDKCEVSGFPVAHKKAVEVLHRTLDHLPVGAVFAVVVPQAVVNGPEAKSLREKLLPHYEIAEICRFPGKVFEFAEMETVVIIGKRVGIGTNLSQHRIRQRIVGEHGLEAFRERYATDIDERPLQSRLAASPEKVLSVPLLDDVWQALEQFPRLGEVAFVGRGLEYKSDKVRAGVPIQVPKARSGYVAGFAGMSRTQEIFSLPPDCGLAIGAALIENPRQGMASGKPTVLVSRIRTARNPWRLKALLDLDGKAAKNNFLVVRPSTASLPAMYLWAILNSPIANAFMARDTMKRDNAEGDIADIPIPRTTEAGITSVVQAAKRYREVAETHAGNTNKQKEYARSASPLFDRTSTAEISLDESEVREALVILDAAVLRLYFLPARLERQLLEFFRGYERRGVGCTFGDYFPANFKSLIPLHKFISSDYRGSTLDRLADRIKPDGKSRKTAVLRAAAEAFGGDD